ncbi:MAG: hypothetical protein ACXVCI_02445 [Bdellovibrionota bacterium]
MNFPFFAALLFSILGAGMAQAAAPCRSIQECQQLIAVAKTAIAANTTDPHVCALTGEVLLRDYSVPELGQAYRDSSGVIWGALNKSARLTQEQAKKYCESIHAELPTEADFQRLLGKLSKNPPSRNRYLICIQLAESDTQILPDWDSEVWSATAIETHRDVFFRLVSGSQLMALGSLHPETDVSGVRCIVRR